MYGNLREYMACFSRHCYNIIEDDDYLVLPFHTHSDPLKD